MMKLAFETKVIHYLPDEFDPAVKEVFAAWEKALAGQISFSHTPKATGAAITIAFSVPQEWKRLLNDARRKTGDPNGMLYGIMKPENGVRHIRLNPHCTWLIRNNGWRDYLTLWKPLQVNIHKVLAHEVGHAIGLGHTDGTQDSIMGSCCVLKNWTGIIPPVDAAAARKIYLP